jgi:hypothetical protein
MEPKQEPDHDRAEEGKGDRRVPYPESSSSTPHDWETTARRERRSNLASGSAAEESKRNETKREGDWGGVSKTYLLLRSSPRRRTNKTGEFFFFGVLFT